MLKLLQQSRAARSSSSLSMGQQAKIHVQVSRPNVVLCGMVFD